MRVLNHETKHRTGKELFHQIERTSYDWRHQNKHSGNELEIELTPYEWSLLREHLHYARLLQQVECSHRYRGLRNAVGELFGAILYVREETGDVTVHMVVDGWTKVRTIPREWHNAGYFKLAVCGPMDAYARVSDDMLMDTVEMRQMEFRRTSKYVDGNVVYEIV